MDLHFTVNLIFFNLPILITNYKEPCIQISICLAESFIDDLKHKTKIEIENYNCL